MIATTERDAVVEWTSAQIGRLNERRRDLSSRGIVIMLALGAMYKFFLIDNYDDLVSTPEVSLAIGMIVVGFYWALIAPVFHDFIEPDKTQSRLESSMTRNGSYVLFAILLGGAALYLGQQYSERNGGGLTNLIVILLFAGMAAVEGLTLVSERLRQRKWLLCSVRGALVLVAYVLASGLFPPDYPGRAWHFFGIPLVAALFLIQSLLSIRLSPELEEAYQRLIRLRADAIERLVSAEQAAVERESIIRLFSKSAVRGLTPKLKPRVPDSATTDSQVE